MSENEYGPREGEADERTRVSHPQPTASQRQPAPPVPAAPPSAPAQQLPLATTGAPAQQTYRSAAPRKKAGYFRSLFDLSYDNLGAPKFARVFQLLFMIATALAWGIGLLLILNEGIEGDDQTLFFALTAVGGLIAWLLLNTLVRLILEAVVGIVQTAENSEEMLAIMRERSGS